MKSKLEEILNDVNGKFENNEVAGVNSIAEYYTDYAVQDFLDLEDYKEIAETVNEKLGTKFKEEDVRKIASVVDAEINNEIEPVGWDKEDNDIDLNKINEIYENNKDVIDLNAFNAGDALEMNYEQYDTYEENTKEETQEQHESGVHAHQEEANFFEEKEEKVEENLNEEDKQSLIENIAEDAFAEMTDGLKNSENVFDSAIGEMYDRWREEYLEEKEAEKEQEIEEAYNEGEKENEQENDKNIEQEAQESGQKEQNEAEFAEAQAKEAAEAVAEMDAGMSM